MRGRQVSEHPTGFKCALQLCVLQAGHLGSAGDDNIESSEEENHKKVRGKKARGHFTVDEKIAR